MGGIVVVGGGQAGASLVAKLRNLGYEGALTLICDEPVPPYQRPPLSKAYLLGEMDVARLYLRPESFYADLNIDLRLSSKVDAVDPEARTVSIGSDILSYDQLAICTGSIPRRLPDSIGGNLKNVIEVRTLADADTMAPLFTDGKRVLVIGGGYIGLEAAAVAAKRGLSVTLIEAADRILQRVASPETSSWFRALHQSHGVTIMEGVALERLAGDGRVQSAALGNGQNIDIDFAIVGIGITPQVALAEMAGLVMENGIRTDTLGRTSNPAIWAAGDCASLPWNDTRIRLESVQNAIDQAEAVAANMLGANVPYLPKPWFWSDQYDVKLQIAGLNTGYDRVVVRPAGKPGSVSHWYFAGDTLLSVDAMNDARTYMVGKRMIENNISPSPDIISDPEKDLKALLSA